MIIHKFPSIITLGSDNYAILSLDIAVMEITLNENWLGLVAVVQLTWPMRNVILVYYAYINIGFVKNLE